MGKQGFMYIVGNNQLTIYIGATSNLKQRIYQHKKNTIKGFSDKYKLHKLLYFESFNNIKEAFIREKQLKNWHRDWKINLIKSRNPKLQDLYEEIMDPETSSG
jgi:putative endonuclease